jgi:hypothetical protein
MFWKEEHENSPGICLRYMLIRNEVVGALQLLLCQHELLVRLKSHFWMCM